MSDDPLIHCTGFRCAGSQRRWVRCFVGWLLACPALLATHSAGAGEQGHGPLSPKREAATFQLADDGLVVELVAAEPNVNSPVAVAWDADGRMYVAEMIDYPLVRLPVAFACLKTATVTAATSKPPCSPTD